MSRADQDDTSSDEWPREPLSNLETLCYMIKVLDIFHTSVQVSVPTTYAGYQLNQSEISASSARNMMSVAYFQLALVELLYGMLGLIVFGGVFLFAACTGRIRKDGCGFTVQKFLNGPLLAHFFSYCISSIAGGVGCASISVNEGNTRMIFALPLLALMSHFLTRKPVPKKQGEESLQPRRTFSLRQTPLAQDREETNALVATSQSPSAA